jgi:hypothetical protein
MRRGEVILAGIARCLNLNGSSQLSGLLRFLVFKNRTYIFWPNPFGRSKARLSPDINRVLLLLCFTSITNLFFVLISVSMFSDYGCSSTILTHNVKE